MIKLLFYLVVIEWYVDSASGDIAVPRLARRNSGGSDNGNCTISCMKEREKIAEYLILYDYESNNHALTEVDPNFSTGGCPYRKLKDKFYLMHIFGRSRTTSLDQCARACFYIPQCNSFNYASNANSCYFSKGPYGKKWTNERYFAPNSIIPYSNYFALSCKKQRQSAPKRQIFKKIHPGKPYFQPHDKAYLNPRNMKYYQVPHSSPWMVNVKMGKQRCSGILIPSLRFNGSSSDLVLTAARCVTQPNTTTPISSSSIELQFGKNHLKVHEWSLREKKVDQIVIHSQYSGKPDNGNDLALLKLKEAITFDKFIIPIRLPKRSKPFSFADCYVTGWEMLNVRRKGSSSRKLDKLLQRVDVTIQKESTCRSIWNTAYLNSTMYCAKFVIQKNTFGCKVDYGAPLTCFEDASYMIYGLTTLSSTDKSCRTFRYSHVGTWIPTVLNWIQYQDQQFPTQTTATKSPSVPPSTSRRKKKKRSGS